MKSKSQKQWFPYIALIAASGSEKADWNKLLYDVRVYNTAQQQFHTSAPKFLQCCHASF